MIEMVAMATTFESLLEAVPDALVGMDTSGVIGFVNHQGELLFGCERDDLVGKHIETLVPEGLWQVYLATRKDYFADPRSRALGLDLELRGRHRDGSEFPVIIRLSGLDTGDVLLEFAPICELARRKRAFDKAQQMTAIVENSEDGIIGKTLGGTVLSWNAGAERMFGYSSMEIIGRSIDLLAPADRAGEIDAMSDRITSGKSVDHFETIRLRKDGSAMRVSISECPIRDEDGVVVGSSTIARDMTEARRAYEASRAMIEASQDSLVSIGPDGKITDANAATVTVTGVPRHELIGTDFSNYFTDPAKAHEIYQRVFTQEVAVDDYALTIRHRDGTLTDVKYGGSVHRGTGGDVLAVFAAVRDVSKLTEAYEAARSMIESSLDSLVAINPDGLITDVNEATVRVTGVSRDELIGTAFSDYFTDPARAERVYQLVFHEGMAVDYPLSIRHRDGRLTEVLYNASAYRDADGNVLGAFAAARDVTKQMQAQRRNAEQQNKEREQLLELQAFQRLTVGRELKMTEIKKENERLRGLLADGGVEPSDQR
ncbi:MAG: PAS domain S-box protein [Phycicoccus sp.]|nr:PAS domain S-box protein [Phycicoccus sp.]